MPAKTKKFDSIIGELRELSKKVKDAKLDEAIEILEKSIELFNQGTQLVDQTGTEGENIERE